MKDLSLIVKRLQNFLDLLILLLLLFCCFLTSSSTTRLSRQRVPRLTSDNFTSEMSHSSHTESELGDHEFCLSRSLLLTPTKPVGNGSPVFVCFCFLLSSSIPRLYRKRVPRLASNNFTCCHTRDRVGRP